MTPAREQFLKARLTGIGGSDCPSLFNVGWGCPRRLWYEKTSTPEDFPRETSAAMELGNVLEPFFCRRYALETGREVVRPEDALHRLSGTCLLVHVDALAYRPQNGQAEVNLNPGVLEVKSCGRGSFYKYKRGGLPDDYSLQLQHAMLVTGMTWGSFAVGCRDNGDLLWWDVEPNVEIQREIRLEAESFWDMVTSGASAPERLHADDPRCESCAYRTTCQGGNLVHIERQGEYERDESLAALVIVRAERAKLRKEAIDLFDECDEELKAQLGTRSMVMAAGYRLQYYEQEVKGYTVAARVQRPLRVYAPGKGKS